MTLLYGTAVIAVILTAAVITLIIAISDIQREHKEEFARLSRELHEVRKNLFHHIIAEVDDGK